MDLLLELFKNPTTAVPAWLLSLIIVALILDKLAKGRIGEFFGSWLARKANRAESREDVLFSIVREMIEERGREADNLEALVLQSREDLMLKIDLLDRAGVDRIDVLRRDIDEQCGGLRHRFQEQRNLFSILNKNLAELTDETRTKFEVQSVRHIGTLEKLDALNMLLFKKGEEG